MGRRSPPPPPPRPHHNTNLHLKKGKAPGLQTDSLDIFIRLARRCQNPNTKKGLKPFADTLATFFTLVANGRVPDTFKTGLRTTYLVALQKDPNDLNKLYPAAFLRQ